LHAHGGKLRFFFIRVFIARHFFFENFISVRIPPRHLYVRDLRTVRIDKKIGTGNHPARIVITRFRSAAMCSATA